VNVGERLVQQSHGRGRRVTKVEQAKRESMGLPVEEEVRCDVLVIGTEGTGARASVEAAEQGVDVLAVTKGFLARSGATLTADGEIAVDSRSAREIFGVEGSLDDGPEQFARDMIREGDYLADQRLVAIHTEEAPARVKELLDWGISPGREPVLDAWGWR